MESRICWACSSRSLKRCNFPVAEFVLNGLVEADDEQRAILEQAHDMIRRKRLSLVQDDGEDSP